jgi:hypothetical protein
MPQSFCPLNMEEEHILLRGGRKLLHHKLLGHQILVSQEYMYIKKTQFSTHHFMECQFQMREMAQKLVNTPLFNFQHLKQSTKDIIAILKDTFNTTSSFLPILDSHVTTTKNFGFCNCHLQLKFNCMRHMQLQICVVT